MVRGNMNRGRGKFGGGPSPRGRGGGPSGGGGAPRGGGGGQHITPPFSTHINDLDMEMQLLQRKRQIFEQEQSLMDRFSNITSGYSNNTSSYPSSSYLDNTSYYSDNSNKRQYENVQQGSSNQYFQQDYSSSYQPSPAKARSSPANVRPQGNKRQAPVWENQNPNPPKRFNAPQRPSPWQNQDTRPEYRSVNQAPPQPKNFSAQTRAFMNPKPGIGQRIKNKYNPPAERKNFNPTKVTKPNVKPGQKPVHRSAQETKKLIEETNKLIAHTNKMVSQSSSPKRKLPPKPQPSAPKVDTVLYPDKSPTGPVKGRLELALGLILRAVKELCKDAETYEYFMIPFIQRIIKQTIRDRIRDVMLNQPVVSVATIVDRYRKKHPEETDLELVKIAEDATQYNKKHHQILQLLDTADPVTFFKRNLGKIVERKLEDMFADLRKMYEDKKFNIEECALNLVDLFEVPNEGKAIDKDANLEKVSDKKETNEDKNVSTDASEEKEEISAGKDSTDEKVGNEDKEISGEKVASDVTDANEKSEKSGETNATEEIEASKEKDANGEVTLQGQSRMTRKKVLMDNVQSVDIKSAVEQFDSRTARARKCVEFIEKFLEEKLPLCLPRFKDIIMSTMGADKEFVCVKMMLAVETKERLRKSADKNTVVLDDDDEGDMSQVPKSSPAKAATPNKPAATAKVASPAAKPTGQPTAAAKPAAQATAAAKPTAQPTTAGKAAAQSTAAKPAAQSTAAKPAVQPTAAKPAAQPSTPVKAVQPTSPAKLATPASTAGKPATPASTPAKPAVPATIPVKPASATSEAGNSVPSTPKTLVSKDMQFVKLLGNPVLPARAVIYDFLKQFNPATIKKHKTISNLLVIGFTDKEGVEKILAANESVVGESTIIVKASEQVATPQNKNAQQGNKTPVQTPTSQQNTKTPVEKTGGQEGQVVDTKASESKTTEENKTPQKEENKTPQQEENKMPQQEENKTPQQEENKTPQQEENKTPQQEENKTPHEADNAEEKDTSIDNILSSDLDSQISDLLSSIRKAEEEEVKPNEPEKSTGDDKMDTENDNEINESVKNDEKSDEQTEKSAAEVKMDTDLDNEIAEFTKNGEKSDEKIEATAEVKVEAKDEGIDKTKTKDLGTIMEVDDEKKPEGKKTKAVEEVSKTVKETGRATPTRSSSRLANVTPSTIKTRRASRLANNN